MIARARTSALLAAALLGGCVSPAGIEPTARPLEASAVVSPSPGGADAPAPAWPAQDWWSAFGDPELARLIEQALAGHPSLRLAAARLARARAAADFADANRGPQATASLEAARQRYSENGLVPPPLAGTVQTNAVLLLAANWELDFFGRYQAALDAALGQARAAQADAQAARVLLASLVARTYYQLARALDQRALAQAALAQREQVLTLVAQRVNAGLDSQVELRPVEGALPEVRQQLEALDEQVTLARNALAALTAQPVQALATLAPALKGREDPAVPAFVPLDLVGRRADVAAARWRIEANLRERDAALAQFYPNINLAAFVGLSTLGLSRLLEAGSGIYGVGPAVRLPIFDAGRLRANLRGRTADLDAAVESYNSAVLDAVREVADQIATLRSLGRQREEQRAAQAAAEGAWELARQRQLAGVGSRLGVLAAEFPVIAQRRVASELKARALDADINLIRALGGGYADEPPIAQR